MNDEWLAEVRTLAGQGRIDEAVALCEKRAGDPVARSASYYTLGILFHMDGPYEDIGKAETYYLEAEKEGSYSSLATYRLAGIHLNRGAFDLALDRFKRVADDDASAAYWAYRILLEHPELAKSTDETRGYLDLAVRNGHLYAQRAEIVDRLKGKQGFIPFIKAVGDYLRLFPRAYRAVQSQEKFLYQ